MLWTVWARGRAVCGRNNWLLGSHNNLSEIFLRISSDQLDSNIFNSFSFHFCWPFTCHFNSSTKQRVFTRLGRLSSGNRREKCEFSKDQILNRCVLLRLKDKPECRRWIRQSSFSLEQKHISSNKKRALAARKNFILSEPKLYFHSKRMNSMGI